MGTVRIPEQELEQLKTTVKQLKSEKKESKRDMEILKKESEKFREAAEEKEGKWQEYGEIPIEEVEKAMREVPGFGKEAIDAFCEQMKEDDVKFIIK